MASGIPPRCGEAVDAVVIAEVSAPAVNDAVDADAAYDAGRPMHAAPIHGNGDIGDAVDRAGNDGALNARLTDEAVPRERRHPRYFAIGVVMGDFRGQAAHRDAECQVQRVGASAAAHD